MSNKRTIPSKKPKDLVTFTISIDGNRISNAYQVVSIIVTKEVNKIPTAKITLLDGDVSKEDFELSNSADFVPGNELEIQAGYHSTESLIFKGIIIIFRGIKTKN